VVLIGLAVAFAVLVLAQGGASPAAAAPPADPHYKCYDIAGPPVNEAVSIETQFGLEPSVIVQAPSLVCLPASKNDAPMPPAEWPVLKCYTIAGQDPPDRVNLTTQFGVEAGVAVGQASLLCIPAAMTIVPDPPASTPPDPDRHYECFNIVGSDPTDVVDLETRFGTQIVTEEDVAVGQATKLCAPAKKNGDGSLGIPDLKCYNITGAPPGPIVNLTTQFPVEANVPVLSPSMLCVPASKDVVGGIAELPALAGAAAEEVGTSAGDSGWSAGGYAALAGGLAAAVVVLGTGALYARRRWLR
jgi:hypothetical protein